MFVLICYALIVIHTKAANMSVQFRTRSQTSVDYSQYITNSGITGCCHVITEGTVTRTGNKSLTECNSLGGHFIAGECDASITPSTLGCCCACKSTTSSKLQKTTLCECESLSGLWKAGDLATCTENQNDLATIDGWCISGSVEKSNQIDFRKKRACCHPEFLDDGTVVSNCTDLCSEKECAELAAFPYTSIFYTNGRQCDTQVGAAFPVRDECALSISNDNVMNSCSNGTNLFCWDLDSSTDGTGTNPVGGRKCGTKSWYDSRFMGKFIQSVNHYAFQIRNETVPFLYDVILAPRHEFPTSTDITNEAKSLVGVGVTKLCPGSHSGGSTNRDLLQNEIASNGYFAILNENSVPVYFASPRFSESFTNASDSPIPIIPPTLPVIDLIATRTFSASINNTTGRVKITGRFYNAKTNQYRTFNGNTLPIDQLIKLYQHNVYDYLVTSHQNNISEGVQFSVSTLGFAVQKADKSFDYYSPFNTENVNRIKSIVRSLPAKNYVRVSLGAYTICGIESNGTMTCSSENSELNIPVKKYKLVSCSNSLFDRSINDYDISREFCFAVDEIDNIVKIFNNQIDFDNQPTRSITNIIDLSCIDTRCLAVVEPDEVICNSQILGSCCGDFDTRNCISTTEGACDRAGGFFQQSRICCIDSPDLENCVNCDEILNRSLRVNTFTAPENTLPTSDLTYYENGLYVGIFEPGNPVNIIGSPVTGNPTTGGAFAYKPSVVGYGTTNKKWAIVVAANDYSMDFLNDEFENTEIIPPSMYDGMWNTFGDSNVYYGIQSKAMEKLREHSRLSGWYLPSKNELEFINNKLNHGFFIPEAFKSMSSGIYLTSTPYFKMQSSTKYDLDSQIFKNQAFMFGQSYSKKDYGSIYLVPRRTKVNVRLIRRIELE